MTTSLDSPSAPPGVNGARRPRRQAGYGVVLIAIVAAIVIMAAADSPWGQFVAVVVLVAALLLALRAADVPRRMQRRAAALVVLAIAGSLVAQLTGSGVPGVGDGLALLLVGLTPLVLARRLLQNPSVTAQSLLGALCVYLLLGMFFALIFNLMTFASQVPFFASGAVGTLPDYLYFSFVTLATLGYGDLVPGTTLGRMLAVTEALTGQLYLVTVVALLVSNYGQRGSIRED